MVKKKEATSLIGEYQYEATKIRDKDGKLRTSRGNGDAVAKAMLLHQAGGGELDQIIHANKLDDRMKPHAKKSAGLRRMISGVMLRALVRNGTPVKIGRVTVEKLTQKVELPKVERLSPEPAKKGKAPKAKRKYTRKPKGEEPVAEAA